MYLKLNNGVIEKYPYSYGQLKADNPNTSFPANPSNELLAEWDVYPVVPTPQPSINYLTQTVVEIDPVQKDGVWVQTWEVQNLPAEQCRENNKGQAVQLLQETDWTTIPDVANPAVSNPYLANQAEFAAYRNQIRQIAVYPPITEVNWPTIPQEVWESNP
jgi:hypothetical protein